MASRMGLAHDRMKQGLILDVMQESNDTRRVMKDVGRNKQKNTEGIEKWAWERDP